MSRLNWTSDMVDFKIYPTLLDSFQWFKEGNISNSEMVDRINRVRVSTPAMTKGKAYHALISLERLPQPSTDNLYQIGQFSFPVEIVDRVRQCVKGGFAEVYEERVVEVSGGRRVLLYGYADYIKGHKIIEAKTCGWHGSNMSHYRKAQWRTYCETTGLSEVLYIITDFKDVYFENYNYNPHEREKLLLMVEDFLDYVDRMRAGIYDTKLFADN